MDTVCCVWRGPPGSGKRFALHTALKEWCLSIGQPWAPQQRFWDAPTAEQNEDGEEISGEKSSQPPLPMDISAVHWGFDIARMSLRDKEFLKVILQRWGRGSTVLSNTRPSRRCLVFYHAHLLSSESIILLQSFLEMNHRDSVVWLTSEYPMPARLTDWFLEIPVGGEDRVLMNLSKRPTASGIPTRTFDEDVVAILYSWTQSVPELKEVNKIRTLIYSFLHRNIRWCEGFHTILFALHEINLPQNILLEALKICIQQPYTGPGQTVPSYRIPMLWENFLLLLRECLAPRSVAATLPLEKKVQGKKVKGKKKEVISP